MRIVIPSVDYADHLAVTLPAWRALLPSASITVVTAPADTSTQGTAIHHGARVVITSAWYANGHTFDKAAAIDEAFGFKGKAVHHPKRGEPCIAADADVHPFGRLPSPLDTHTIYGCPRYLCTTQGDLEAHKAGRTKRRDLPLMLARRRGCDAPDVLVGADPTATKRTARACLGYLQLFRYHPGLSFGSRNTAGGYDLAFRNSFPKRAALRDFYVLHLGTPSRRNWKGRVVSKWGGR